MSNKLKKYEVAGKGSYGIVITPALPNKDNQGKNIEYPHNVTKIFKQYNNYKKAINNSNQLQRTLKNVNIKNIAAYHPYKRKYTLKNIPSNVKNNVKDFTKRQRNNQEMYLLHTPYLGVSCVDVNKNHNYRKLRQLSYQTICKEMYKSMEVVKSIHDAGYIHGDIRETNVLCNLETGKISIIDFDLLNKVDDFLYEYPEFFYSHPPECLFIWGRDNISELDLSDDLDENVETFTDVMNEYDVYNISVAAEALTYFKQSTNATNIGDQLYDIAQHFIDSYGLGLSFKMLLQEAWYVAYEAYTPILYTLEFDKLKIANTKNKSDFDNFVRIRQFIFEVLIPRMTNSDYRLRWNINKSLEEFGKVLRNNGIEVGSIVAPNNNAELRRQIEQVKREIELMKQYVTLPVVNQIPASPVPKHPHSPGEIVKMLNQIEYRVPNMISPIKGGKQKTAKKHK